MIRDVTTLPPLNPDRRIAYGDDVNQFIDLWDPPAPSHTTVVFVHGGFWRAKYDLGHASFLCAALARHGMHVASLEYRRVGNPGGGWPGSLDDVIAGTRKVCSEFTGSKLVLCGHSAGGHLALRAASEFDGLAGVVALAPVAVLRMAYDLHLSDDAVVEFLGGTPMQKPDAYDAACPSLHGLKSPAILIHGSEDEVVPVSISREFFAKRKADGVQLEELAGTGHMESIDPEAPAFQAVANAIERLKR